MKKLKLRSVIFDMDGVITNTMPYHMRAWRKVFADQNLHVPKFEIYRREGQKGIDSVLEIAAGQGRVMPLVDAHKLLSQKEKIFKKIVRAAYIPGSRLFLKQLKKSGFKLALVTGTSLHEVRRILPEELFQLFDVVISGSDVQNGKPHPEPYLKAIKGLQIRRHEAVVIENAPFGIRSAKKAGLKCFALETSLPNNYLREADQIFRSIKDMTDKVEFIFYACQN